MLFKTDAEKAFGVETYLSSEMENAIKLWEQMEMDGGKPPWANKKVQTIRFSNTIAEELAKLITQNIDIKVQGVRSGSMPEQMQKVIDKYFLQNAKDNVYSMVAFGGVMAKWDGKGVEFLRPGMFLPTEVDSSKEILAAIFLSYWRKEKKFYTKMEWHRFEDVTEKDENGESRTVRIYHISTKTFRSDNENDIGKECPLSETKWKDIEPEAWIEGLEKPLFCYIKCPTANNIDHSSPLGVPCFANCTVELEALDVAMSALKMETKNSTPMMIVDQSVIMYANQNGIELPEWVSNVGSLEVENGTSGAPVDQWNPTLQVTSRKEGINFYLNVISMKTGFSQGYFSFNEKQGLITATQVEADERRTIDTIMTYRNLLDRPNSNGDGRVGFIHDIAYIINAGLIINGKSEDGTVIPYVENGNYKLFCDFGDPFFNKQEDMMLDLQLANQGYMSKVRFLVLHRGYTEAEARRMVEEARKESEAGRSDGLYREE